MQAYAKITVNGKLAKLIAVAYKDKAECEFERIKAERPGCNVVLEINPNA